MRRDLVQWKFILLFSGFIVLSHPAISIAFGVPYHVFRAATRLPFVFQVMGIVLLTIGLSVAIGATWYLLRRLAEIRNAWRFRLTTSLVLMVAASLILFANVYERHPGTFGFPADIRFGKNEIGWDVIQALVFNIQVAILLCLIVIATFESAGGAEHSEFTPIPPRAFTVLNKAPSEFIAPPQPENSPLPRSLSTRERWIYSLPMFFLFAFVCVACITMAEAMITFRAFRVDLPLPTVLALDFTSVVEHYPSILFLGMFGVSWFYFGWVVNDRRRVLVFNLAILAIIFLGLCGLLIAGLFPFFKEPSCVVSGSRVRVPGGELMIDKIQVGDEIISVAPDGELHASAVTSKHVHIVEEYLRLILSDGTTLSVTAEHPIAQGARWTPAGKLHVGDDIATSTGVAKIHQIDKIRGSVRVFDISVSPTPNFFANGVLVHNKMRHK